MREILTCMSLFLNQFYICVLKKVKKVLKSLILGDRGLEIHRYGAWSTLFVAIYRRLLIGHWRHHFESTFLVWHAWAHWWKVVGNPQILRPNWHFDMMEDDTIQCMFLAWGAWNTLYWLNDVPRCLNTIEKVSYNIKSTKNVELGEFLKNWSLPSSSVNRQANFERPKIGRKC